MPNPPASADSLHILSSQPAALIPIADLSHVWALDTAAAAELLADLVNGGDVELWPDAPEGPACILSAGTATTLGLVLADEGGTWRWVGAGSRPASKRSTVRTVSDVLEDGDADQFEDPRAIDPAVAAELVDEYLKGKAHPLEYRRIASSLLLLGVDRYQWPDVLDEEVCPCHVAGPLGKGVECLACLHRGDKRAHQGIQWRDEGRSKLAGGRGKARPARGKKAGGSRKPLSKVPPDTAQAVAMLREKGWTTREILRAFKIGMRTLRRIEAGTKGCGEGAKAG